MSSASVRILALFDACPDDACIRPRSIIESTGLNINTVRKTITRLVARGKLFHVGHGWYARREGLTPPARVDRYKALEARIEVLENLIKYYQMMGKL